REVFDRNGSDAMRWFLMASPILRGGNLVVTEEGIRDAVRTILLPLWSTWYFFSLYANTTNDGEGYRATRVTSERVAQLGEMDRYLLARTHGLAVAVTEALDVYDIAAGAELIRDHLDVLTNWYVRTQRDRFWTEDTGAYDSVIGAGVLGPEPVPLGAHIPVGQHIEVVADQLGSGGDVVDIQRLGDGHGQPVGAGQQIPVHLPQLRHPLGGNARGPISLAVVGGVGVQAEEVPGRPQRQQDGAHRVPDAFF